MKIADRLREIHPASIETGPSELYVEEAATLSEAADALDAAQEAIEQLLKCHDAGSEQLAREALTKLKGE
jgi:hypothetical protein